MTKLANMFKNLCKPALIYLVLSVLSIILIGSQNMSNGAGYYCVGNYECNTSMKFTIFISKILYIVFWTLIWEKYENLDRKEKIMARQKNTG